MLKLKSVAALALAAVMTFAQPLTAFASSTDPANTNATAGTANVLDYQVETILVPTILKVGFNVRNYEFVSNYTKATSWDENEKYYVKSGGFSSIDYTPATNQTSTALHTYYKANVKTDQVVSLNYGIVNKSTWAKKVAVKLTASYSAGADTSTAVQFVNSQSMAISSTIADPVTGNTGSAAKGEYKVFLTVASAKSASNVTLAAMSMTPAAIANSGGLAGHLMSNNSDTDIFYETANGYERYTVANSHGAIGATNAFVEYSGFGKMIKSSELVDIEMTPATVSTNSAFVAESITGSSATAWIGYKLEEAEYAVKSGESISYGTTQDDMEDIMELDAVNGYTGFTLTGNLNQDADWTKAAANQIVITPTYSVTDADGDETGVDGTVREIELTDADKVASGPRVTFSTAGLITMSGLTAERNYAHSAILTFNGTGTQLDTDPNLAWGTSGWSAQDGGTLTFQLNDAWLNALSGKQATVTVLLSDDSTIEVTTTF